MRVQSESPARFTHQPRTAMHSHRKGGEQPPIASLASESASLAAEAQVTPSPLADDSRSVQDALPASHLIEVQRALAEHDVATLRALSSRPGGFLTSELRKRAWRVIFPGVINRVATAD